MKKNIFVALFAVVCIALVNGFSYSRKLSQSKRDAEKDSYQPGERDFGAKRQLHSRGNYNVRRSQKVAKTERSFCSSLLLTKILRICTRR